MKKYNFEENLKNLMGDDYVGDDLKKADPIDEAVDFLLKSSETDLEEKIQDPKKNKDDKSGLIPKGTEVFSSVKEKKFVMTRDHHTNFSHDVGKMLIFDWSGDSFYVNKKDVLDYEDGTIMSVVKNKEKSKKDKTKKNLKKSENLDGIKDVSVKNKYEFQKKLKNSLGYKRTEMPQVSNKDLDKLLVHFDDKTKVKSLNKKISSIKFAQGEVNEEKVLGILGNKKKLNKMLKRTYVISLDGYLLDGHHGISALLEENSEKNVNVKRISLPFKNLKKRVNQMKISKKVNLEDKKV